MADNLLALQVQPPAPIGPALTALTNLQIQRTQLGRQNLLYNAIQSGDWGAVARAGDPGMAQQGIAYDQSNKELDAWHEFGQAAAAGDPVARAKLAAVAPKYVDALTGIDKAKADIFSTLTKTQIESTAAFGPQFGTSLITIAGESDKAKRDAMLPAVREAALRAGVTPEKFDQEAALLDQEGGLDKVAAIGRGYLALGTTAQQELGKAAFGVTTGEPGKPQSAGGAFVAAQGNQPLQNNGLAPAAGPAAAVVPPPGPAPGVATSAPNLLAAQAPGSGPVSASAPISGVATPAGNLLAAQAPGGGSPPPANALAPPPPVVAPAIPPPTTIPPVGANQPPLPPDLQAKYDERAKTLANYGLKPEFVKDQLDKYRADLLAGAPKAVPAPAPVAVPAPAAAVAIPAPAQAPAAPAGAPAVVPAPVAPVAAPGAPPATFLGVPAQRTPGSNGFTTTGGPAYEEVQKATSGDLVATASMPNQTKQRDLQIQTQALLTILKNPNFVSGAGAADFLALDKVKQTFLSLLGQHDPQLDTAITDPESFGKFATLAAAAVAKQDVGSRVTNFDLQTFLVNQPGIGTSLQGNMRLLGIVDQVNSRNLEISRLAQDTVRKGGQWGDWVDSVNTYQSAHPIVDPATGEVLTTSPNGSFKRGAPVSVTKEELANGILDDTYHLLPSTPGHPVSIQVDGTTYLYQGAKTGRPGVTGAAAGTR